jgi:hypothetical protein
MFRRNTVGLKLPERRRHVRIVTLRNFGWLTIAMLIAFAIVTVRSEMRGRNMNDYGRLLNRQIDAKDTKVEPKPVDVVEEGAPAESPLQRESQSQPMMIVPADQPAPVPTQTMASQVIAPRTGESKVAIVGGPEGVAVVQQTPRRPVLAGGFGRP